MYNDELFIYLYAGSIYRLHLGLGLMKVTKILEDFKFASVLHGQIAQRGVSTEPHSWFGWDPSLCNFTV